MALYHLHLGVIGRSKGKSAVAAAAYRAGERIVNETDGIIHDYRNKGKSAMKGGQILYNEIMTPKEVPDWARNRATLWNEVEKKENRKNSQFAKDMDIALQKELSLQDNIECVKNWIGKNFIEKGLVADFCIHDGHKEKGNISNNNIHAHIMSTLRGIDKNGWNHNKIFQKMADEKIFLDGCRSSWADIVNAKFTELGIDAHIDHRTLEAQGIDREAQQHQGVAATAMQRRGEVPDRTRYRGGDAPEPRPTAEQRQAAVNAALEKDPEYIALKAEQTKEISEFLRTYLYNGLQYGKYDMALIKQILEHHKDAPGWQDVSALHTHSISQISKKSINKKYNVERE